MRGGSASTKRLRALLLTLLCVAARFQGIVCPGGGGGGGGVAEGVGGGVGAAEGVGAGAGAAEGVVAGEGGAAAGAARSGSGAVGEGASTYTSGWLSSIFSTGAAADPGAAAGSRGRHLWSASDVIATAFLASAVLAFLAYILFLRRR